VQHAPNDHKQTARHLNKALLPGIASPQLMLAVTCKCKACIALPTHSCVCFFVLGCSLHISVCTTGNQVDGCQCQVVP
jgi:hypothetical protein